jgi:peptide/nickel transport system substrate-binding protein
MLASLPIRNALTRRRFLEGAAVVGVEALAGPPSAAQAQATNRTLVIASPATPQGLDMEYDISLGSIDAVGALYDGLLAYETMPDPEAPGVMREDIGVHPDKPHGLALQGRLAETWDLSADGRKATFVLRQGVKSNWGNTLSAADVKWTWDRKFHLKGTGAFITKMLGMTSEDQVKVEAPNVVSITLEKPSPLLLKVQCNLGSPIYDSIKLKDAGGTDDPWGSKFLNNQSAGFGPYEVAQIVRGQQAVFRARRDYWGAKPFMDTVVMREVPSSSSRLSLLQGGAVDIAQFLQPRECMSLKASPVAEFDAVTASYMIWLELNGKTKPFDNADVRRAMNLLIPRTEIISTVYYGLAEKQDAVLPLGYPMRNAKFFDYDENLDKAKQLLKAAGLADGFSTTLSYNAGDPVQESIALIYQTSLRRAGINASLDKLPAGVFYENVTKRQKPVIFYLDSPWTPDAGYATSLYFDDKSYVDYSNYSNPHVDELIERGLLTTDDADRTKIYDEVQRIVMDDAPWGLIAYPKYILPRRKTLKGFTYYTSNNLRFQDFYRS